MESQSRGDAMTQEGRRRTLTGVDAANRLTRRWAARVTGGTAISGVGVWVLLAALCAGAGGAARAELEEAVGLRAGDALPAMRDVLGVFEASAALRVALGI